MLEKLPHKNLFYFGFIVVFVFIGLSYWQLTRYQQDKLIIDSIDSKDFINEISMEFGDVQYWMDIFKDECKLDKKLVKETYKNKTWKHEKVKIRG